ALANNEPVILVGGIGVGGPRPYLVPLVGRLALYANFEDVARRPFLVDLCLACESEPRLLDKICADVDVLLRAVVPPEDGFIHPSRNRKRDLAVALARRGRLELGNALLKI